MGRRFTASTGLRAVLTCCLCMLAFLFAVEAKTAWYGPMAGLGSNVRAAKAMRADAPQVIEHGVPVQDPSHPQIAFVLLPALAFLLPLAEWSRNLESSQPQFRRTLLSVFSPQLSLRPPPALA